MTDGCEPSWAATLPCGANWTSAPTSRHALHDDRLVLELLVLAGADGAAAFTVLGDDLELDHVAIDLRLDAEDCAVALVLLRDRRDLRAEPLELDLLVAALEMEDDRLPAVRRLDLERAAVRHRDRRHAGRRELGG
jgi:hypothetical protein